MLSLFVIVQVISPHQVMGIVEIVEHLSTVQDKVYDEPTVLVVDNVTGAESVLKARAHRLRIGSVVLPECCLGSHTALSPSAGQLSYLRSVAVLVIRQRRRQ